MVNARITVGHLTLAQIKDKCAAGLKVTDDAILDLLPVRDR